VDFSGEFLQRFEIQRKLGAGGMGEVFLAREKEFDRLVAIKTVLGMAFDSAAARARFQREAKLTAALSHPNIIRVIDHGEDGERLWIAFEFVEGGDLGKLLRERGAFLPEPFFAMAIPILDAVACAHEAGVLHRDLKADNVLLDKDGQPRLADFGLAKGGEDGSLRTATGMLMGTPRYMAPELGRGQRATDAADQYALGVLLFEMLCGLPPFDAPNPLALLRLHCDEPAPPVVRFRTDVPVEIESLVLRALEKGIASRWKSVAEMRDVLVDLAQRGLAWTPRDHAAAPETMMGVEAQATPQPAGASAPRVRRGTGRIQVLEPAPTPAPGAMATNPQSSGSINRSTGRIRRSTISVPVMAPPPARPAWHYAAGVLALVALLGGGALALRPKAPKGDPRYDALTFRLDRHRHHSVLYWDRDLPAAQVKVAGSGAADVSATSTSMVRLDGTGQSALSLTVELTDPAGAKHGATAEFPAPTLRAVVEKLERIRKAPGMEGKTEEERALEPELRISGRYARALREGFGLSPQVTARFDPPADLATRAREAAGIDAVFKWYKNEGLEETLEQAAALMSGPDWRLKARVMQLVHPIANFEAFCLSSGMRYPSPALRFTYGLKPGPHPHAKRNLLGGDADFSRPTWATRLLPEYEMKQAQDTLKRATKNPTATDARVVHFKDAIKVKLDGDSIESVIQVGQNARFIAYEFEKFANASLHGQGIADPIPLDILLPPRQNRPPHVTFLIETDSLSELVHLDVRFGKDLAICHRLPPGMYDQSSNWEADHAVFATVLDTAVLADQKAMPTVQARCDPSDGLIKEPYTNLYAWRGGIHRMGLVEVR
jgi:serine/threonine protein kinase